MEQQKQHLKLVPNLPEKELKSIADTYIEFNKNFMWPKLIIFAMVAIILMYNFFVAGKSYSISDYNTIKMTMAIIFSIIALLLLVFAVITFKKQKKLRSKIKAIASKNNMPYKDLKKELMLVLKSNLGGVGV